MVKKSLDDEMEILGSGMVDR